MELAALLTVDQLVRLESVKLAIALGATPDSVMENSLTLSKWIIEGAKGVAEAAKASGE